MFFHLALICYLRFRKTNMFQIFYQDKKEKRRNGFSEGSILCSFCWLPYAQSNRFSNVTETYKIHSFEAYKQVKREVIQKKRSYSKTNQPFQKSIFHGRRIMVEQNILTLKGKKKKPSITLAAGLEGKAYLLYLHKIIFFKCSFST